MGYRIELPEDRNYILIRVEGEVTVDLVREWSGELTEMSQAHGIQRFLFDARKARNVSSAYKSYRFAHVDSDELNLKKSDRSAILTSPDDPTHEFVVLTFRNAGFNMRLFTDKPSAIEWLLN